MHLKTFRSLFQLPMQIVFQNVGKSQLQLILSQPQEVPVITITTYWHTGNSHYYIHIGHLDSQRSMTMTIMEMECCDYSISLFKHYWACY